MYIVTISKHKYYDDYTTQFLENVNALDRWDAVHKVRAIFPPIYIKYGDDLIAYFTGQVVYV